jgi:Tfp pilus assembly protein PilF
LIYFNDGKYKEAKEECMNALESLLQTKYMGSYMVKIHYTIGLCEVKTKEHQAARENFQKAKKILENIKRKRQVDEED